MEVKNYNLRYINETIPSDRKENLYYKSQSKSRSTVQETSTDQEDRDMWGRKITYIRSPNKNALDIARLLASISGFPKNSPHNSPSGKMEETYCTISRSRITHPMQIEVERTDDNHYRIRFNTYVVDPKNISKLKRQLRQN